MLKIIIKKKKKFRCIKLNVIRQCMYLSHCAARSKYDYTLASLPYIHTGSPKSLGNF